jgi:hypothetical protein
VNGLAGATYGNTPVTIYGSDFSNTPDVTCRFTGVADVGARWISPSAVICISPERASIGNVTVEFSSNKQDFTSNFVQYRYASPAVALSLLPCYGPVMGDQRITVQGMNFEANSAFTCIFTFDDKRTESHPGIILNSTCSICISPSIDTSMAFGNVMVAVTNNAVDVENRLSFIYFDSMEITRAFPSSGPFQGGSMISIIGAGFAVGVESISNSFSCTFGSSSVQASILSGSVLTCISPASTLGQMNFRCSFDVRLDGIQIGEFLSRFLFYGKLSDQYLARNLSESDLEYNTCPCFEPGVVSLVSVTPSSGQENRRSEVHVVGKILLHS